MLTAGVIGWPVAHSKSPLIHRFWLAKLGLDGDYSRFAVHPDHLGDAIRALPALGLRGVNVTVPHKVAVMAHLDAADDLARAVGAVNTVIVKEGQLVGYNTDVAGFRQPLDAAMAASPQIGKIDTLYALLGTGGAARAAATALRGHEVTIFGRNKSKSDALADELGLGAAYGFSGVLDDLATAFSFRNDPSYASVTDTNGPGQRYSHVIVNATTLGMSGEPPLRIDLDGYPDDTIVYDLVYSPVETQLLAAARARGMTVIDGLEMLVAQAAFGFELFFGAPAPREHDAELRALLTA